MKRLTLTYVATYLLIGGVGLALAPSFTLTVFLSNGDYGDIMPRVVGMFMIGLGGVVAQFLYARDYRYYPYTVVLRSFFVFFMFILYAMSGDPLFVLLNVIVLAGLLPSIYTLIRERPPRSL